MKIVSILCNRFFDYSLEASYKRAFEQHGFKVNVCEVDHYMSQHVKFSKIGTKLNQFVNVEPWQKKAGRDIALELKRTKPDLILMTGGTNIHTGALAYVKSILKTKLVYIWQDPLVNMNHGHSDLAAFVDLTATFNSATVSIFENLGFRNVNWIPLAADEQLHRIDSIPDSFKWDITFLGGWRPEREHALSVIVNRFPKAKVKIWGVGWERVTAGQLKKNIENRPLFGQEYASAFNTSMINLNVIDELGYPAANMRFFELLISHGLQLCSTCPDMEKEFLPENHLLYFQDDDTLCEQIEYCFSHQDELKAIKKEGYHLVDKSHLYKHRVERILETV